MDKHMDSVEAQGLLDRAGFLKLAGAAGLGAAAGASLLSDQAAAAVRTNLEPTDFTFRTREKFRPFHLLAENFVTLDDNFEDGSETYTTVRPGPPNEDDGFTRVDNGRMRFDGQDDYYTILVSDTGQRAPFSTVIVDVASLPEEGTIYAGLYRVDGNEFVHAYYDSDTNRVGFEVRVNGQTYTMDNPNEPLSMGAAAEPEQRLFEEPFRFAFVANENRVIALVSSASDLGGWRPIIERDIFFETGGQMDLRDQSRLEPSPTALKNGFGARSEQGNNILFDRVRAGYFGEAGVRDPHAVQYADGTPYIKNNKLYFTQTNAGLGFFEKAHWGVWTLNLADYSDIEQVGNIFWRNVDSPTVPPNKVLGHHAGQIVRDEEAGRWIVVASSWGDFGPQGGDRRNFGTETYPDAYPSGDPRPGDPNGVPAPAPVTYEEPVDVIYDERLLTEDILRGVHILEAKKHPINEIPFPTEGKWDPGLTRIDGVWYLAYVIALDLFSDFQPALAKSPPGGDHLTAIEFVGADWEKVATEGPIIQKLGGEWRLFASCGDDEPARFEGRYPIYFLEAANPEADETDREAAEAQTGQRLQFDGYLDAPHPTNIPHPMIVPISYRSNGQTRTKYIMITFNGDQYYIERLGYGTHGDFYVMQAEETVRGREFPRR
jgi:hypothetical protein